jgi:hypothetical protein
VQAILALCVKEHPNRDVVDSCIDVLIAREIIQKNLDIDRKRVYSFFDSQTIRTSGKLSA